MTTTSYNFLRSVAYLQNYSRQSLLNLVGRIAYYAFSRNNPSLPPRRRNLEKAQEWLRNWAQFCRALDAYLGVEPQALLYSSDLERIHSEAAIARLDISNHQDYPGYLDIPGDSNPGIMQAFGRALLSALDDFRKQSTLRHVNCVPNDDESARWILAFPGTSFFGVQRHLIWNQRYDALELLFREWEPMPEDVWPWEHPYVVRTALRDLDLLDSVSDLEFGSEPDIHLKGEVARLLPNKWKEVYETAFQLWRRSTE